MALLFMEDQSALISHTQRVLTHQLLGVISANHRQETGVEDMTAEIVEEDMVEEEVDMTTEAMEAAVVMMTEDTMIEAPIEDMTVVMIEEGTREEIDTKLSVAHSPFIQPFIQKQNNKRKNSFINFKLLINLEKYVHSYTNF